MKNYYKLLGVNEQASEREIISAYNAMYHKCSTGNHSTNREEQLIDIVVAYNALTNNKIKKEYDKVLRENSNNVLPVADVAAILPTVRKRSVTLSAIMIVALIISFAFTIVLLSEYVKENRDISAIRKAHEEELIRGERLSVEQQKLIKPVSAPANAFKVNNDYLVKKYSTKKETRQKKSGNANNPQPTTLTPIVTVGDVEMPEISTKNKWEKGEVLKMKGTPNAIVRFDKENEIWCYNNGNISFNNGQTTTAPEN